MTDDEIAQCVALYAEHQNLRVVAEKLGHAPQWVKWRLQAAHVPILPNYMAKPHPDVVAERKARCSEMTRRCRELRRWGMSYEQIGIRVGLTGSGVEHYIGGMSRGENRLSPSTEPQCDCCGLLAEYAGPLNSDGLCAWCEGMKTNPSPELSKTEAQVWAVVTLRSGIDYNDHKWMKGEYAESIAANLGVDMELFRYECKKLTGKGGYGMERIIT